MTVTDAVAVASGVRAPRHLRRVEASHRSSWSLLSAELPPAVSRASRLPFVPLEHDVPTLAPGASLARFFGPLVRGLPPFGRRWRGSDVTQGLTRDEGVAYAH